MNKIEKILVVDDTPENIEAARKFFCSVGYQEDVNIHFRSTPKDAKVLISDEKIDFAMFDLEMETKNGEMDKAAGHKLSVYAWRMNITNIVVTQKYCAEAIGTGHAVNRTLISCYAGSDARKEISGPKSDSDTWKAIWQELTEGELTEWLEGWVNNVEIAKKNKRDLWEYIRVFFYVSHQKFKINAPMADFWEKREYTYSSKDV